MQKYNKNAIKYINEKRDKIALNLPKGEKELWKAYAESKGTSITSLIRSYVNGLIEADGFVMEESDEKSAE